VHESCSLLYLLDSVMTEGLTLNVVQVGTKRYDSTSGGEREIQRTMLELLNQLDGFDSRGDVKVLLATNRIETLDPALLRPGRIDRKIEFSMPDLNTKRRIFQIHTRCDACYCLDV
jgi:ATP-dependent 26S proteasome regulatory subunit